MNRRFILGISAMTALGLALLPGSAVAQQGTLKQQLVGTWTLVSCDASINGAKQPYCVNPNGILMFDAGGRYVSMIAARARPKFSTANRLETKAEEFKATVAGVAANFGTWSVNEADKTITTHFEGALSPAIEGTDAKESVSLAGDELKTVTQFANNGTRIEAVYRRAK